MSLVDQSYIDTFMEYHYENFHRLFHRLYIYFHGFYLHLLKNTDRYLLYFTIVISIIILIINLSIVFKSNMLMKFFLVVYSFHRNLFFKVKKKISSSSKTSLSHLFNWLLYTPHYIQKRFLNEFLYSLNQKFSNQKVTNYIYSIIVCHLRINYLSSYHAYVINFPGFVFFFF